MSEDQEEQYRQYLRDKKRRRNLNLAFIGIVLIIVSAVTFIISIALYPKPIYIAKTVSTLLPTHKSGHPHPATPTPTPTPTIGPTSTATAQAQDTATAQANVTATAQAQANATATVQALPTPDQLENEIVAHTPEANIRGVVIWPYHVAEGQSVDVDVSLVSTKNLDLVLLVTPAPETPVTQEIRRLTPLGTPDVEIMYSYGPGYEAFAIAELSGTAFTITPSSTAQCQSLSQQVGSTVQCQSLDQQVVSFHWSVLPNKIGLQTAVVSITGVWKPGKGGESIYRPIIQTELNIDVGNGPVGIGEIVSSSVSILGFMGGLGLTVPWIWDHISKWWIARRKK